MLSPIRHAIRPALAIRPFSTNNPQNRGPFFFASVGVASVYSTAKFTQLASTLPTSPLVSLALTATAIGVGNAVTAWSAVSTLASLKCKQIK